MIQQASLEKTRQGFQESLWIIQALKHPLELVPDEAERHFAMALLQMLLGNFTEATNSLNLALDADPHHMASLTLLGEMQFKFGDYAKAIIILEQIVSREPDNLTAITWLCMSYHSLGFKDRAMNRQNLLQNIIPHLVVIPLDK
jgi:tetratricopeptide (TPR) repeat protein